MSSVRRRWRSRRAPRCWQQGAWREPWTPPSPLRRLWRCPHRSHVGRPICRAVLAFDAAQPSPRMVLAPRSAALQLQSRMQRRATSGSVVPARAIAVRRCVRDPLLLCQSGDLGTYMPSCRHRPVHGPFAARADLPAGLRVSRGGDACGGRLRDRPGAFRAARVGRHGTRPARFAGDTSARVTTHACFTIDFMPVLPLCCRVKVPERGFCTALRLVYWPAV